MRSSIVRTLDDKDLEFVEMLQKLGIQQNVATMIAYLMNIDGATSRQIEIGTDLRQPQVSIGAKTLRYNGWLVESELKREGKGRPMRVYKLKASIDEIINHLEKERIKETHHLMQSIQKLKQLAVS